MANEPKALAKPFIRFMFDLDGITNTDYGYLFKSLEFKGMINGGYIVRGKLFDSNYNLLSKLISTGYFKQARIRPIVVTFQILSGSDGKYPETATRTQKAIILSLEATGGPADVGNLEFIAIDPPSWYLNIGDAAGVVWKGRVDQVIRQVVQKYAPKIQVDVSKTVDSTYNQWWMMRMDPKTFLTSLMDWSSSITQNKTQWILETDGFQMMIREQGIIPSKQRAFYRYYDPPNSAHDTISHFSMLSDNALSLVQTKLISQGASVISGQYLDRKTDQKENKLFVKDSRTSGKQIASVNDKRSFSKPPDSEPPQVGWSAVSCIPEIYSAGELGMKYDDYIDGRPRAMWLNLTNALLRAKFSVVGHGEWSDSRGLGTDTFFVRWVAGKGDNDSDTYWWVTGNWLVYGFHHKVARGKWMTDVYGARFDWNAAAKKVGGSGNS